jgi:hypothetical protein
MKKCFFVIMSSIVITLFMTTTLTQAQDYFVYGEYAPGQDVYAVDGYGDLLYVANGSGVCYIYRVTIPAGEDPNMHPDNPDATGTMAVRTFTQVGTAYNFAGDCGWFGNHNAEFYVDEDYIYYGPNDYWLTDGGIEQWVKNPDGTFGTYLGKLPIPVPSFNGETLGHDPDNNIWYICTREREIYSFEVGVDVSWQYEFTHPNYSGGHHDGMEFVGGYIWVSDMTTDNIGQFEYTGTGPYNGWDEVQLYNYTQGRYVEGMGFGPLGHFWITAGWTTSEGAPPIYEVGGGSLQAAVEGIPDQCIFAGELFTTFDLDDYTVGVPPFTWVVSGAVSLSVGIDIENVTTVTYAGGWTGNETITFAVTDSRDYMASDDATFTVWPVPVVGDIPDQTFPYETFDLDDFLSGIDPADVTWANSVPGTGWTVVIDGDNVVTVTSEESVMDPVTITFTATTSGCGREASDSDDATFTPVLPVAFDIKPQSCPNPLNVKDKGNIPVAILGTSDFDVLNIDPTSVLFEGVAPLRWAIEDVTTPIGGEPCDCTTDGPDGFDDLTIKFKAQELIAALGLVNNGDEMELTITGSLLDGTPIEGSDCVIIKAKNLGKELTVSSSDVPEEYALFENFPNPFNPSTTIQFAVPEQSFVKLEVYNSLGERVTTLVAETLAAGIYSFNWNAINLPSGVYIYSIQSKDFFKSKKMILMK